MKSLSTRNHREDMLFARRRIRIDLTRRLLYRRLTSFFTTRASRSTGFELSYSMNSFIAAGKSLAESQRRAWTPIAFARAYKVVYY
jgi:hypothetical protein